MSPPEGGPGRLELRLRNGEGLLWQHIALCLWEGAEPRGAGAGGAQVGLQLGDAGGSCG